MASHIQTGDRGESLAVDHLKRLGYRILACNWRTGHAEIDIIAFEGAILTFVEVKTRSSTDHGDPEEFVNHAKEAILADAAGVYMEQIGHDWEIRFDVIAVVTYPGGSYALSHYKDVFFPGLH